MSERLYTERPRLYDAIQSEWDYDRDVAFVEAALEDHGVDGRRLLEAGCGTGEHTRRFLDAGFDVTATDKYEGMLDRAREKCEADFRQMALPEVTVSGPFDAAVAIRGVVNHLPPAALQPALDALADSLADGGLLVFDNSPLPADGNHPAIDVGTSDRGDYGRIAQHVPVEDGRLEWRELVFAPDGDFFANTRLMTPFDDDAVTAALEAAGLTVETHDGFGPADRRTVFVAVA